MPSMSNRFAVVMAVMALVVAEPPAAAQDAAALFDRGVALHGQGRYREAVAAFDEALRLAPSSETYRKRGLAWRELGRFDETYADYERALAADPANVRVHRGYAMALQIQKRYDEALQWCRRGLEIDPGYVDLWITRGAVERDLGRDDEALASFERALAIDPTNTFALNFRGVCASRRGDARAALDDYDRALAIDPGFSAALGNRAAALLALERPGEAAVAAQRAVDAGDADAQPFCVLGRARVHLGQRQQALAPLDRCLELEPDNGPALLDRSSARLEVGDAAGAFADADRLVVLEPDDPKARNNRGAAQERLGRLAPALADFEAALRLDPGFQLAERNRERVAGRLASSGAVPGSAVAAAARPAAAAQRPATAAVAPAAAPPLLRFSPTDDPCRLAELPADGLPWAAARPAATPAPPAGVPGALPSSPFLELETLSRAQWTGAVSAAVEGLRIAHGAMSEEDARAFEAVWAPLYDSPSRAAVDYLNRLVPLLGQLLAGREALVRAVAAVQQAMHEAAIAVEEDDPGAWESAMAMADRQAAVIESLDVGLARLAAEVQALGNPPNPFDERCQARQRYRRGFRRPGASPVDGVWTTEAGTWESYLTVLEPRPGLWLVYRVDEAYYDRVGELAADGRDVSKAGTFEVDDGSGETRFEWTIGILDHLWLAEARDGGRKVLLHPYGPAIEVHAEVWELVADGVADRAGVTEPAPAFGGEPRWSEDRLWRQGGTAPLFSHQHSEASVRAAAEPYLAHGLTAFDAFVGSRGELIARLAAADLPEPGPDEEAPRPAAAPSPAATGVDAAEAAAVEETIAFHEDMANVLERNLARERAELERTTEPERRRELNLRILTLQADVQAERDLAASYRTGTVVHTRTGYDDWAQHRFVQRVREEAARVDDARRIAAGVERQIELLPWEQRSAMRARARELLDPATLARGDVEKARQVASALDEMIQGHWEGEAAREEERAIAAEESEFIAQTVVMTAGAVAVGFGSAAALEAFGETAALTLWAPHLLGGVYGGVTGTIAGGPAEGAVQSISMASPAAALVVQFVEGYRRAIADPGATWSTAAWEGAKQAGTGYAIAKAFQLGAQLATRGAMAWYGPQSRLFRPIGGMARPGGARLTIQDAFDEARYVQSRDDAQSLVDRFRDAQINLMRARTQFPAGSPELAAAERAARELAVSLNSSFHCKWLLKYRSHPSLRRAFSSHVGAAYDDTLPVFERMLRDAGYDTSNLRFRPLRNASSAGTSSMDLDLGLDEPPGLVIWRTDPASGVRSQVSLAEFQRDGQRLLSRAYHQTTGFSAVRSEVNLTTSVHDESFASRALLRREVDFSRLEPGAFRDVGRVVDFKASKVEGDPVLGRIAKLQAKCREASKEVDNMLLAELRQARATTPAGSAERQQLDADIRYWEEMAARLRRIGADEADPHRILMLDREIRRDTGGAGAEQLVHDVAQHFRGREPSVAAVGSP